jgi:hypothetical protein
MIKWNKKFEYPTSSRAEVKGTRTYDIKGEKLPSVTTVLSRTKDQEFLKKWKAKVGEQEADRIKNHAANRGSIMHKYIEDHLEGNNHEDMTPLGQEAKLMARKIIDVGLEPLNEIWGSEVTLMYPDLYAGSTDLVGVYNNKETLIDFKQANRPKVKEWIGDYFLQAGAYCMAHDYMFNTSIHQAVIMVCTPDLFYQEFRIEGTELKNYKYKFLERLNQYHEQNKQ